jgi:hypothetical protein
MSDSYLLTLFGTNSASSTTTSLLEAVYGGGSATPAASSNPVVALQTAEATEAQGVAAEAKQPQVALAVAQFTSAVQSATSVNQLLSNPAALTVLLTANGLGDQTQYTALARQALDSNPAVSSSLANELSDTNWAAAAQTYQFATKGLAVVQTPQVISAVTSAYVQEQWETAQDQATPGIADALAFLKEGSTISSAVQILGDPILRRVVTTALGIPAQIAYQDLAGQEQAITSKLDIANFQNPQFVSSFVDRYMIEAQSSATSSTSSNLISLAVQAGGYLA